MLLRNERNNIFAPSKPTIEAKRHIRLRGLQQQCPREPLLDHWGKSVRYFTDCCCVSHVDIGAEVAVVNVQVMVDDLPLVGARVPRVGGQHVCADA